jgi:hypothetical protein
MRGNMKASLSLSLAFAGCLVAGCATGPVTYSEHDSRLVGTWSSVTLDSFDIGYFEKTYFPDGSACGFMIDDDMNGTGVVLFRSHWRIEGDKLISTVVSSTDVHRYLNAGDVIVDRIEGVTPSLLTLRSADDGNLELRYKVPEDRGDKLCHLKEAAPETGG